MCMCFWQLWRLLLLHQYAYNLSPDRDLDYTLYLDIVVEEIYVKGIFICRYFLFPCIKKLYSFLFRTCVHVHMGILETALI